MGRIRGNDNRAYNEAVRRTLAVLAFLIPALASQSQDLTPREQEAFRYLQRADILQLPYVNIGGARPGGFAAMTILKRSRDADAAFKELVRSGTTAGKLYGLIGVYRTDRDFFESHVRPLATSSEVVGVLVGCVVEPERVSSIVDYTGPRGLGYVDIVDGRYSAMFFDLPFDQKTEDAIRTYKFSE
jgi:hypothetical protein